jgi:hypothetical protein
MFVLRRITSQNVEINTSLGDYYVLIDKVRNPKEYQETLEMQFQVKEDPDIYGFITYENGSKIEPLYRKSSYWIMGINGQTFANVTSK